MVANSYKSLHVFYFNYGTTGFISGSITESAPFVYIIIWFYGS